MTEEIWRIAWGWDGRYEVSNLGRVRKADGTILGQWQSNQGYMLVRLAQPRKNVLVHRLVAKCFVQNEDEKPFVNHLDCVRSNNESTNLAWCTQLENLQHSAALGRMQLDYWRGRRTPAARLTDDQVREMRRIYATGKRSWEAIGKMFGVSKRSAGRAIKGETYANVQ